MPHKLLLADDSVTIQRVIELTFADEDVQVIAVSDGDQAIARIDADPPDIVLADIGMPGRDGYQVAEYIKSNPRLAHIPVVLLTGAFEPVDQARALSIGCDGVLAKPFEPQLVIGRVKELLARPAQAPGPFDANATRVPQARAEPLAPSPAAPPPAAAQQAGPEGLEDYFDRLDAAFANLPGGAGPAPAAGQPAEPIDWFETKPSAPPAMPERWDASLSPAPAAPTTEAPPSLGSPPSDFERAMAPERAAVAPVLSPLPPAPVPSAIPAPPEVASMLPPPPPMAVRAVAPEPATRPAMPPLADAFAALLAAEQSASGTPRVANWPAANGPAPAVSDDLVEEVARRVLERLSDRVVRELASDIVSRLAERLVREEIERIKASIA